MVRILLVVVGLAHAINGVWMLVSPESWYASIPGVVQTGPLNHHFVQDIGMAFVGSGGFLILGASPMRHAAAFAISGATFPLLHTLIHVQGWLMHGLPHDGPRLFSELVGVASLSVFGGLLARFRAKAK
jgi:hypothetical protein